jgi:hypothetical protein
MRISSIALVAAVLAIPSAGHSQDQGLVGGKVGPNLDSSAPSSALRTLPSASRPVAPQEKPGFGGAVSSGQMVPRTTPVTQQWGGAGVAFVNGHRVLVDTNSGRITRVLN